MLIKTSENEQLSDIIKKSKIRVEEGILYASMTGGHKSGLPKEFESIGNCYDLCLLLKVENSLVMPNNFKDLRDAYSSALMYFKKENKKNSLEIAKSGGITIDFNNKIIGIGAYAL